MGCSTDRKPRHIQCFSGTTLMYQSDIFSAKAIDDGYWRIVDTRNEVVTLNGNCVVTVKP